jgi:transmembrane sensor
MKTEAPMRDDGRLELAAEWQVRLQDAPADAVLRAAFDEWLRRDLRNRLAYADVCAAAFALEQAEVEVLPRQIPAQAERSRGRGLWYGLAASLLVLTFAWQGMRPIDALRSDLRTAEGELREFTLPDGSHAWLAGDTALALDFEGGRRAIEVLRGEAMFEVVKDPAHPFVVSAGDATATAVGTRYAVSYRADAVLVEVEEGKVAVADAATPEPLLVTAGQQVRRDAAGLPAAASPLPAGALDWRRGLLVLEDAPLADAVARLDAWIPGRVLLLGRSQARISAAIAVNDAPAALEAIAVREGLQVETIPGVVMVVH